ncbi:hypothetical protein ILUMI_19079, partial [Ignelater luminosus]
MSASKYQQCHEELGDVIHDTAWRLMKEAATEEAALARQLGEVTKDNHPYIIVVADDAWSKGSSGV